MENPNGKQRGLNVERTTGRARGPRTYFRRAAASGRKRFDITRRLAVRERTRNVFHEHLDAGKTFVYLFVRHASVRVDEIMQSITVTIG